MAAATARNSNVNCSVSNPKGNLMHTHVCNDPKCPGPAPEITYIENRDELIQLQNRLGVRHDWHEPDNNEVNAYVLGYHLDNAMGSRGAQHGELVVHITQDRKPVAAVNLATLLAFACGTYEGLNR